MSATATKHLLLAALLLASRPGAATEHQPDARTIMERATVASGDDAWRLAETNLMTGNATLYRDGNGVYADRYEMRRVYPRQLSEAHTSTGKFRLDAYIKDKLLFTMSFDGERMYDQNGPLPDEQASETAESNFGFSAVRFALDAGFRLTRMADDQVAGHPAYFVQVTDPTGGKTLVGVDKENWLIRSVGWQTPRGWHVRIYDNYYRASEAGFMQPGHVRLYYDGVKTGDINWTGAEINLELPDAVFRPMKAD
jgi:hypothetical protein